MSKKFYGHPAIPLERRCMILNKYSLFPYMTLCKAVKLSSGAYDWVSRWDAGHRKLGYWEACSTSIIAVLSVKDGEDLEKELDKLRNDKRYTEKVILDGFMLHRDAILDKYSINIINEPAP